MRRRFWFVAPRGCPVTLRHWETRLGRRFFPRQLHGGREPSRKRESRDGVLRQCLGHGIHRGNENCPMNAQTVQNITTMREFIHSAGMVTDSKDMEIEFLLDGARRPCSTLYRSLLQNNSKKNQRPAFSSRCEIFNQSSMSLRSRKVARLDRHEREILTRDR